MSFNNPFKRPSAETTEPSAAETQEASNVALREELAMLETEFGADETSEAIAWYFKGANIDIAEHLTAKLSPASDSLIKFLERSTKAYGYDAVQASLAAIGAERGIYDPQNATLESIRGES